MRLTARTAVIVVLIMIAGLLSAMPGHAQTGAVPSKEDRVMFRDKDGVDLIVTRAGAEQRELDLEIRGGAFNRNQARLESAEAGVSSLVCRRASTTCRGRWRMERSSS